MAITMWIAVIFLTAMLVPLCYYAFLAVRTLVRASREASDSLEATRETERLLASMPPPESAATAGGQAKQAEGAPKSKKPSGGAQEQADIEQALAQLERKSRRSRKKPHADAEGAG